MSERWDRHFLNLAAEHAKMSKDPSSKIGAVIVGPDREIRSVGFNGFPRGVADTDERLNDREQKYDLVVHAELNAVLAAAMVGTSVKGCTLYLHAPFGGPPCIRCTVSLIQAGIIEIVGNVAEGNERWRDTLSKSREILAEVGITYREFVL